MKMTSKPLNKWMGAAGIFRKLRNLLVTMLKPYLFTAHISEWINVRFS